MARRYVILLCAMLVLDLLVFLSVVAFWYAAALTVDANTAERYGAAGFVSLLLLGPLGGISLVIAARGDGYSASGGTE